MGKIILNNNEMGGVPVVANPTIPSGTSPTDLQALQIGNSYYNTDNKTVHFIKLTSTTLTEALRTEIMSDDYFVIIEYSNTYYYEKTKSSSMKTFESPLNTNTFGSENYNEKSEVSSSALYIKSDSLEIQTANIISRSISARNDNKNVNSNYINSKTSSSTNALRNKVLMSDGSGGTSWENPNLGFIDPTSRSDGDVLSGTVLTAITNKLPVTINDITFAYSKKETYTESSTDYDKIYYYSIKDSVVNTFYLDTQDNKIHFKNYSVEEELPATLGTAGQVLKVNAGGNGVEWANPSGGSLYLHYVEFSIQNDYYELELINNSSTEIDATSFKNFLYDNGFTSSVNVFQIDLTRTYIYNNTIKHVHKYGFYWNMNNVECRATDETFSISIVDGIINIDSTNSSIYPTWSIVKDKVIQIQ